MKLAARTRFVILGILLILLAAGAYFRRDLGTAYVAGQFRSAKDAPSELEAARKINQWIHWTRGYRVVAKDAQGNIIKPYVTGNYDAVDVIEITWDKGTRVERKILNRNSLHYIYGE